MSADRAAEIAAAQASPYRYDVKYFIVSPFGDLLYSGTVGIGVPAPIPTEPRAAAVYHLKTAESIRRVCDQDGAPQGRILIAAVIQK